jgi:multidrug efflux pump subunit AcrB
LPVIAALSVSLFECLIVFPVHLRHLPVPPENDVPRNLVHRIGHAIRLHTAGAMEGFVARRYGPFIAKALEWRYFSLSAFAGLMIVTFGLIGGGIVKFVLFPESDNDFIIANIELLPGAPARQTELVGEKVYQAWKRVEARTKVPRGKRLTKAFYTVFGGSIMGPEAGYRGNNNVEVVIELLPTEERKIYYRDLLSEWEKETGVIPDAVSTDFSSLQGGPGGPPLEIRVYGKDRETLLAASGEVRLKLEKLKGVYGIKSDYRPGLREFKVTLKPEAYQAGYSISDVANYVNAAFYGSEALRIQRGRDDVKVKVRFPELEGRNSIENFERMWVRTTTGKVVPVSSLVEVRLGEGESSIKRENRRRLVTLSADVNRRVANAEEISRLFEKEVFPALRAKYPGVEFSTEGQAQEWRDSLSGLKIGFTLAALANYIIIATQFRSYIQPLIILVTIPFGFVGAILAHLLFSLPLTMMSMFGLVALSGIVVNDAIVMIDCVNRMLSEGMPVGKALAEAGKRRFRAVLLTTFTTFCGLMPIIFERSMQAIFLIPMAVTIAFGVAFATLLTLILVPCLFMVMNDLRRLFHRHPGGVWPTPEDVEPAAGRLP